MAHQTTIATRWLLSQKNKLDIAFVEHKWDQNILNAPNDIQITINFKDKLRVLGRGTSTEGDLALEKASSEVIERWCCQYLNISTVGCAVHSNLVEASLNSKKEVLERFYFDQFVVSKKSHGQITTQHTAELSEKMKNYFKTSDIEFHLIQKSKEGIAILCIAFDKKIPITLGLSFEKDLNLGIYKSFFEAVRNFIAYTSNSINYFEKVKNDSNLWCCNPDFIQKLIPFLSKEKLAINQITNLQKSETPEVISSAKKVSELLPDSNCPLYFSSSRIMTPQNKGIK